MQMNTYWRSGLVIAEIIIGCVLFPGCAHRTAMWGPEPSVLEGNEVVNVEVFVPRAGWFRRPAAEGAEANESFGTVRGSLVQLTSHPNEAVAKRINRALVEAAEPGVWLVERMDGAVLPEFSAEHPADLGITQRAVLIGPEILSVITESSYRPAGAAQWTDTTEIQHFDLKTGQPVRWAELVRPADWPSVRAAALTAFADDVDVLLKAEFARLPAFPEGYLADGVLWLLVREETGSSAGETGRFYPMSVALVRGLLNPAVLTRFAAGAVTLPPPGWMVQRTKTADGAEEIAFVFAGDGKDELAAGKLRVSPQLEAGEPELLQWTVNTELNLGLLHYFAGWVGTLGKYAVTRVAVLDLATGKLLGCPPRSYTPVKGAPKVSQPVYRVEAGRLVVEDGEWGGMESFPAASSPDATAR